MIFLRTTNAAAVPDSMRSLGKHGDKISFHHHGDLFTRFQECPDGGEDFDIFPVATILNFQRQFMACKNFDANSSFGGTLHGIVPAAMENNKIGDDEASVESAPSHSFDLDIPILNDSQNSAANKFLTSTEKEIQIIQG